MPCILSILTHLRGCAKIYHFDTPPAAIHVPLVYKNCASAASKKPLRRITSHCPHNIVGQPYILIPVYPRHGGTTGLSSAESPSASCPERPSDPRHTIIPAATSSAVSFDLSRVTSCRANSTAHPGPRDVTMLPDTITRSFLTYASTSASSKPG